MARLIRASLVLVGLLLFPSVSHASSINFAFTVTNVTTAPTTYAISFSTPVLPDFYTYATSVGQVTVTPSQSGDPGVVQVGSIYPTYISGYGTMNGVATNLGVDLGTAPCSASTGVPVTCQFPLVSNTFSPTFYNGLEALITFQMTGIGTTAVFSGTVTLEESAVPEPASLVLLGTGVLTTLGIRRRRA